MLCASYICFAEVNSTDTFSTENIQQSVVFRTTQHLVSRDGREIYLYPSRKCELFDGDRLIATCTYRLQDGEVRLLDENGDTVYKGTYRLSNDRRNLSSLTLAGTTYYTR